MHVPVMLGECLEYLNVRPDGIYLDATAGLGGHSRAIAERLTTGLLLSCDRDSESLEQARANTAEFAGRIRFLKTEFSSLGRVARAALVEKGTTQLDGLLADLGVSRYQLTEGERGFSFASRGPLDMRMDRSQGQTAADIVNYTSEAELANLIFQLGEERRSRKIARAIVRARPVATTSELAGLIENTVPRTGKLHPATQTFMALRIAVNREQEELQALLQEIPRLVRPGGRAVILTFMSTEDRAVKHAFQALAKSGQARILTRHVIRPSEDEVRANAPSRSAKLRAIELLAGP